MSEVKYFTPEQFKQQATAALADETLKVAMARARDGFIGKRSKAKAQFDDWDTVREEARLVKDHALNNLDHYLARYEQNVQANGGQVHFASDAQSACEAIVSICQNAKAQRIAKGKSMVGEEVGLNQALEAAGMQVTETDLGEYIIQLAKEPPSHIIAPAVHKTREQVTDLFAEHHQQAPKESREALVQEAREVLRERFLNADVGITGANLLIAETGQSVLVTNEGNGDLCATLPRVHIVITGIEKVVGSSDDACTLLRLLSRSATGQPISNYTSFFSGPKREGDADGPEEFHVVLLDNGRSRMLGTEFHEVLRCFRCGACLNHCPVYGLIGGHAYGTVYPGPIGSVVSPHLINLDQTRDLPNACTLNGRCGEVCPMSIPLPSLLRKLRQRQHEQQLGPRWQRLALSLWGFLAERPRWYHQASKAASVFGRVLDYVPALKKRVFAQPAKQSFQTRWQQGASATASQKHSQASADKPGASS